jgi:hypothetical protein
VNDELEVINRHVSNVNEKTKINKSEINKSEIAMEVHHHPKVEKKNFKEYFLEFLMIFLAVTMGFFAESIHEHFNKNEIEKRNIESYYVDLQKDSSSLIWVIRGCEKNISLTDSLSKVPGAFTDTSFQKQLFYYGFQLGFLYAFNPQESAFQQMQSSGTLGLIQHQNVLDSILNYHSNNQFIKMTEELILNAYNHAVEASAQFIDFRNIDVTDIEHLAGKKSLRIIGSTQHVQEYINWKINQRGVTDDYVYELKMQLACLRNLMPLLRSQYNIE